MFHRPIPTLVAALLLVALCGCRGGASDNAVEPAEVHPLDPDTLQAWLREGRPAVLLDTRSFEAWQARHLPGATPVGSLTIPEVREVLPFDPSIPIVIYGQDGDSLAADHDLATEAAEEFGFPWVYRLNGGLAAWEARGHDLDGNAVLAP